jgi:ferredoxin-thioredoxin reductase catalytic subunit
MKQKRQEGWPTRYAQAVGALVNPAYAECILEGLEAAREKLGDYYCPCKLDKTPENICPCQEMAKTKRCHCGMFSPL